MLQNAARKNDVLYKLQEKLSKAVLRVISKFGLIREGDRILVAISGGNAVSRLRWRRNG